MKTTTVFLFILITLLSCQQQDIDTKSEGEKLMQISREWSQAAASRDIEKVLSYWSEDAILISAGQPPLKGKQAIRQMVESSFNDSSFQISWEPESAEISKSGDLGYLIEKTKIQMTDSTGSSVTQHFNAVTIWKKQADGGWKNVVDMMSPDPSQKE